MSTSVAPFSRGTSLFSIADNKDLVEAPPENKLVKKAEHLFQMARSYRDEDLKMQERWRSYRSWYLSTGRDRGSLSSYTTYVNMINEKIEKLWADVTEAMPAFSFRPIDPKTVNLSEHLNRSVPAVWEESNGNRLYRTSVKSALIYGTDIWKIEHDPGYGGRGMKIGARRIPAYRFFPAPYATDVESAPWVIEICPRPVDEIFNDYGKKVRPELMPTEFPDISEDLDDPRGRKLTWATNLTGSTSVAQFPSSFLLGGKDSSAGIAWQKELWIRDPALESRYWIEDAPKGPELRQGKDLKHPRGRVISWANGKLLYDRENEYLDGRWPYARFVDAPFPEMFWGLGEVPNLINLQLLHDDTVDNMRLIHAYMANPKTVIDESTGLRDRNIGNDPGEIWWTRRGTQDRIKIHQGATPPAEYYTHVSKIESWFDRMTGSLDVLGGHNPSNVTSGRQLGALQQAAGIRVRARMKDMEETLLEIGRMLASRVQQFAPSQMQLRGENEEFKEFIMEEDERLMPFRLRVDVVSNLDAIRAQEFQKLLLLFNLQLIDETRLLRDSGISSSDTLLAELPAVKQKAMMMQAMAAQQQGGGLGEVASNLSNTQKSVGRAVRPPTG